MLFILFTENRRLFLNISLICMCIVNSKTMEDDMKLLMIKLLFFLLIVR